VSRLMGFRLLESAEPVVVIEKIAITISES
jgi:hypothetical protein